MVFEALQIEGTWEQVAALGKSLAGQHVRLTVFLPAPMPNAEDVIPIEQAFAEIMAELPESERVQLPADLAEQHDHYIYGWPKK